MAVPGASRISFAEFEFGYPIRFLPGRQRQMFARLLYTPPRQEAQKKSPFPLSSMPKRLKHFRRMDFLITKTLACSSIFGSISN